MLLVHLLSGAEAAEAEAVRLAVRLSLAAGGRGGPPGPDVLNGGHVIGGGEALESFAAVEGVGAHLNCGGKGDVGEVEAPVEGVVLDLGRGDGC